MQAIEDDDFMPTIQNCPRIASDFTGWHYKDMREIVPFCELHDPEPPDFLEMCIQERKIKDTPDLKLDEKQ